jgi:hypothetical protein
MLRSDHFLSVIAEISSFFASPSILGGALDNVTLPQRRSARKEFNI